MLGNRLWAGIYACFVWAFFATAIDLAGEIDAFFLLAIIYLSGAVIFILQWLMNSQQLREDLKEHAFRYTCLAILGIGLHDLAWIGAVQLLDSVQAAAIIYFWPACLAFIETLLKKGTIKAHKIWGLVICSLGIAAVVASRVDEFSGPWYGYLVAVFSALSWSLYSGWKSAKDINKPSFLGLNFLLTGLFSLFIWWGFRESHLPMEFDLKLLLLPFFGVLVACSYIGWEYSREKSENKEKTTSLSLFVPAMSALFLVVFTDTEANGWILALAFCLITIGNAYANKDEIPDVWAKLSKIWWFRE